MSENTPLLPRRQDGVDEHGLPWSERLQHFTWAWFEVTMSTGALATLIGQQPYNFVGLGAIGWTLAILNIALFAVFSGLITYRFSGARGRLLRSLHHPHESFFFGAYFVSIAMILYCVDLYAVPIAGGWLLKTVEVLYWVYAGVVMPVAVLQYHIIFDREKLPVADALPSWILPVYPFLMLGVLGSALLKNQPPSAGLPILVGSIAFQGLGWTVAYFMLTIYVARLVNTDLPGASERPAMFVAVGPASYTVNTFVALGMQAPRHIPRGFLGIDSIPVGDVFKAVAVAVGVFMWLVAFWFSALSTVGVLMSIKEARFTLNWWGFIFPNVGLSIALLQLGDVMDVGSAKVAVMVATVGLFVLWVYVAVMNVRAVLRKEVLWPGRDEDMEDVSGEPESARG